MGGVVRRLLAVPPLVWLAAFLGVPSLLLFPLAFASRGAYGEVEHRFTWGNFARLAERSLLDDGRPYVEIAWRTLGFAAGTTALTILIAYPVAFFVASLRPRWRATWLLLLTVPFCTNLVVRLGGMQALCDPALPLARALSWLHLAPAGEWLYPSSWAVYLGMLGANLPLAIFPLYANVERLDRSLVEAARDLYAGPWRVFRHAVLPQTYPGLASAALLTFVPALGTFVVSDMLGGSKVQLLGNVIQSQFGAARDYPFGAAITLAIVVLTFVSLALLPRDRGGR